jgi:hypothetical protein
MKTAVAVLLVGVTGLSLAVAAESRRIAAPVADLAGGERTDEPGAGGRDGKTDGRTVLGVQDTRFTLNGRPTFLLGISYYGGLGAPEDFVRRDLDDLQRHGFNWLRVWATWGAFDRDISAVGAEG